MSKISIYEVVPVPKLADKLVGTSVGGEPEDLTYNFTLGELLNLFIPNIPGNTLQGVLDFGNTATQDIILNGTIFTTYLEVTDTATILDSFLTGETHITGGLYDRLNSVGTAGQVLRSTGTQVEWYTIPTVIPDLQQVLTSGNTAVNNIILTGNLSANNAALLTSTISTSLTVLGTLRDGLSSVGANNQVLSSNVTGVRWINLPVYSATSPLLYNSGTGVFSIQQANASQNGYLSSADWINFDGKQNAGNYIVSLIGEATGIGPGAATVTLNTASVTGKLLTGLNLSAGGNISATDSILVAFGKVQNQISSTLSGVIYKGVWNAATNSPTLSSSVGVQGWYYVVNVAGNTDLNGITDWQVGDWAIFNGTIWNKVDNTDSVTSVNGQVGAVSLTTDNIPEGATNLYYLDSRARAALSFIAGSGAYNNTTGVITIPTDNSQILNGANYITLTSLSATSPLIYNNLTGAFSIQVANTTQNGYLSSIDWNTFNGKQDYLNGTGLVKSVAGTISYITDNSANWNTAYNDSIVSAAVTGTATKTLTLNQQDGGTITASWSDIDTGLTSVGVSMPAAFSVANSPLTSNGTIAVTGAGTTLQYIDGTGALQNFPGLTGYVPYTGATQNVDLGEFGISAGYFQADLTPTGALQVGRMQWNSTDGTMDLRLMGNNVTLQIGQENVTRVVNKSGIDLLEANYQVVRVRKVAEGGAQGQRLAVVLAQGNNENNSTEVIGLVTETILVNQEGFVTAFGEVKNINTTGSLQGETWVDGDILYLSDTIPGQLTKVRPIAPNHAVIVGYVTYAHVNNGKIYMAIDTGYELGELHNVYAPSPTANQSIYWDTTNSRYQLNTIGGILGYTPANAATTISTTAPLQGGGDLSANRTFSITQSGASTDGYLSSTDWNTFNNKQPAGSYVPTSRQLTINGTAYDLSADRTWSVGTVTSVAALTLGTTGTDLSSTVANSTTTPVITLNVPTASAANRGALSAADWSTFNTKVGGVTASSPLASSGGSTPNITIQQSSGSQDGYLSSTDWITFNNKQAAGNYITSLTGEATGTGPGATAVTLNNASVTAKILTGINITGGTVQATDTMLTAFGKLQNQINGLIGSTIYQGTWNASTNTPALASGVGVRGYYYIVSVAGNTNLDGITDWFIGDWAIFDGTAWQQVDNTDAVVSVNGQTGAVSLTTDNIPEGATNQYFLNSRARAALSFTAGSGAYNSTTGVITIPTNNNQITNGANYITLSSLSGTAPIVYSNTTGVISITQAGTASNGYLSSTDWNTFNNKQATLSLTTTGTSGAATLVGATLNIPDYGSALSGYVTLATAQTISGAKTFSGTSLFTGSATFNSALQATIGILFPTSATVSSGAGVVGLGAYSGGLRTAFNGGYTSDLAFQMGASYVYTFPASSGTIALVGGSGVGTVTSVAALTIGTSGTDLSSTVANSTTTPVITLNVPTASATNRGALSSADWTTFNNKQSALTNPVTGTGTTNYLPKFTGTSTIGDSPFYDASGSIGLNTITPALNGFNREFTVNAGTSGTARAAINIQGSRTSSSTFGVLGFFHQTNYVAGIESSRGGDATSGILQFFTSNTTGATEKMRLDASGNLGLGVTPSAWISVYKAINIGSQGLIYSRTDTDDIAMGLNWYRNSGGSFLYNSNGYATIYAQNGGQHVWYNAPSGTAGAAITFTQAMTLTAAGRLLINTPTESTYQLDVNGTGRFSNTVYINNNTGGAGLSMTNTAAPNITGVGSPTRGMILNGLSTTAAATGAAFYFYGATSSYTSLTSGDLLQVTNNDAVKFRLDYAGAATFSSSVTAGAGMNVTGSTNSSGANYLEFQTTSTYYAINAINRSSGNYNQPLFIDGQKIILNNGSGGNVGIGTTSPVTNVDINSAISGAYTTSSSQAPLRVFNVTNAGGINSSVISLQCSTDGSASNPVARIGVVGESAGSNNGAMVMMTRDGSGVIERMRITSGGNVLIADSSGNLPTGYGTNRLVVNGGIYATSSIAAVVASDIDMFVFSNTGASYSKSCIVASMVATGGTGSYFFYGQQSTSTVALKIFSNGNIQNTNNSYGAISDARLKENIIDATPKLDDLMKVKVRNYNLKGESNKQLGVISQELEAIFPNMIEESTNIGSDVKIKGVKYSVFVPMLIKAVQELKAEIEILKNK